MGELPETQSWCFNVSCYGLDNYRICFCEIEKKLSQFGSNV